MNMRHSNRAANENLHEKMQKFRKNNFAKKYAKTISAAATINCAKKLVI